MNDQSQPDKNVLLFTHLITMLGMSAVQQLGKLKNPITDKTEINLQAAQATIDIIDMLEVKTKGNLGKDEEKLLKDTLSSLKLNYVETSENSQTAKPADSTTEETGEPTEASDSNTKESAGKPAESSEMKDSTEKTETSGHDQTEEKPSEEKNSKFHKSYE